MAANPAVWGGPKAEAIYDQRHEAVVAVLLWRGEQIGRLSERVARQDERIAELERRLGRSSRNSFLPPSQDPPGAAPRGATNPTARKQARGRPRLAEFEWCRSGDGGIGYDSRPCCAFAEPSSSASRPAP